VPNLITDVATTEAAVADVKATAARHPAAPGRTRSEARRALPRLRLPLRRPDHRCPAAGHHHGHPGPADHSPQARAAKGFDKSAFAIDWKARQVRCPAGHTNINWNPVQQHGKDAIVITFSVLTCRPCPFRFVKRDPQRAMKRMIREANALGMTVRFDPIEAA
jgi:hypothetical protein